MQAALDGPGRHFGARSNAELVPDAFHMTLGGSLGDEQTLSDLLVGHTRSHHGHHLAFTPAQHSSVGERFCGGSLFIPSGFQRPSGGEGPAPLPPPLAPRLPPPPRPPLLATLL